MFSVWLSDADSLLLVISSQEYLNENSISRSSASITLKILKASFTLLYNVSNAIKPDWIPLVLWNFWKKECAEHPGYEIAKNVVCEGKALM